MPKSSWQDSRTSRRCGSRRWPEELYLRLPIKMSAIGTFHPLTRFFKNIGELKRIVTISNLQLKHAEVKPQEKELAGGELLDAEFIATTYQLLERFRRPIVRRRRRPPRGPNHGAWISRDPARSRRVQQRAVGQSAAVRDVAGSSAPPRLAPPRPPRPAVRPAGQEFLPRPRPPTRSRRPSSSRPASGRCATTISSSPRAIAIPSDSFLIAFGRGAAQEGGHTVLADRFALDELHLAAIAGQAEGEPGRQAMFVDSTGFGVIVRQGDHIRATMPRLRVSPGIRYSSR